MLDAVILAAGKGTRMRSDRPKVLHPIAGRPMVRHVLDAALGCADADTNPILVVGHGAEQVQQALSDCDCHYAHQTEQLGTGHAAQQALPHLRDEATVLILYGDVPLIQSATLDRLAACATDRAMGLLTMTLNDPTGYGRIVRDAGGAVTAIVEQKDATEEQLSIAEINTGIMAVKAAHLRDWLSRLDNDNAQGEYYLTDIIAMAHSDGVTIEVCQPASATEVQGVNNRLQQAELERAYQKELAEQLMRDGVTLLDPMRFDCRGTLRAGADLVVDVNCVFEGEVRIGRNVTIGPNCCLKDAVIGDNVTIKANTVIDSADVADHCEVGPYARLRPQTRLEKGAKVGNFVEVKKSVIGEGSKVNHLSYIGDCDMGSGVNIGAGTITCNYDGVNKFRTQIGKDTFVGSNTALVAPVNLADTTTVGAGSVVTRDTEAEDLAIARSRQRNIKGWQRPQKT